MEVQPEAHILNMPGLAALMSLLPLLVAGLVVAECMRQLLISVDEGMRRRRRRMVMVDVAHDADVDVALRPRRGPAGLHGVWNEGGREDGDRNWNGRGRGRVRVGLVPDI
ncbi:uncharacterized protein DSM5745_00456 [Aspergillus mulundensis]|uniref:Uncharacterized protein n=1 Tax=Aspergillus mulundensis TaxID=1810919 RepID=A0A3D8T3K6_9EURO|nr:hypothetical protein DSM5745_00456 [Aspergillus mulundensis]RDW93134.1 hypothetical protein DSM5745_00456 [Aspergillus mulundensis]